jgi:hypothetical protein
MKKSYMLTICAGDYRNHKITEISSQVFGDPAFPWVIYCVMCMEYEFSTFVRLYNLECTAAFLKHLTVQPKLLQEITKI